MSAEPDSGRYYRDQWREKVMELAETTAKEVQELGKQSARQDEQLKSIRRTLAYVISGGGAIALAIIGWLLTKL